MSTIGPMVKQSRSPSSVLLPNTLTTWWHGCRISWMMRHCFLARSVSSFHHIFKAVSKLFWKDCLECTPTFIINISSKLFSLWFRRKMDLAQCKFYCREVVNLGEEAHLNTSFKHFIFFVQVSQNIFFRSTPSLSISSISRNFNLLKRKNWHHYKNWLTG